MNSKVKDILINSQKLNDLKSRIHDTFREKHLSENKWQDWEHACEEFHKRFDMLVFPGGHQNLSRIRLGDIVACEAAIDYLEADPYHFRSGYLKKDLWRWLRRVDLASSAVGRLERTALSYLHKMIGREFGEMCKTMAKFGRADFWKEVAIRANLEDGPEKLRADLLLTYGACVHAGAKARRKMCRKYSRKEMAKRLINKGT